MEIYPGMDIIGTALWLNKEKILILNDLHLGYEEALLRKGIFVPKFQMEEVLCQLRKIFQKIHPTRIVINGDVKHEFGSILKQEWHDVLHFLDILSKECSEVIIIQGNHDPIIKPLAARKKIVVAKEYRVGDVIIVHGDALVKTDARVIIIGHEHPAITLRDHGKYEKYKCFLKGKWKRKELVVVPSFNPLLEGTDILKEKLLSPFLENIQQFEVYVVGENDVFHFGKVKNIRRRN